MALTHFHGNKNNKQDSIINICRFQHKIGCWQCHLTHVQAHARGDPTRIFIVTPQCIATNKPNSAQCPCDTIYIMLLMARGRPLPAWASLPARLKNHSSTEQNPGTAGNGQAASWNGMTWYQIPSYVQNKGINPPHCCHEWMLGHVCNLQRSRQLFTPAVMCKNFIGALTRLKRCSLTHIFSQPGKMIEKTHPDIPNISDSHSTHHGTSTWSLGGTSLKHIVIITG